MGTLFVVATPIGNMEDLSPRALRVLREVDLIAAEDTRPTGAMLRRLGITTTLLSNHGFNERARVGRFLEALERADVALVSDAGTPAVSDPGAILVRAAVEAGYRVAPIPGPSAVLAAVSASGLVDGPFTFLGFLPRPSGERNQMLEDSLATGFPLVLFETGPRIARLAELLAERAPDRAVAVFRELTKLHEESIHAPAHDLPDRLAEATLKGEFVLVVGAGTTSIEGNPDEAIRAMLARGERPSDIARVLAKQFERPRSELYERVLELQLDSSNA
ncbi:MAG: 16S rRNA (cytidine(1402)-2'-O)-methyltransferase [Thermomicrobiales bacterium]